MAASPPPDPALRAAAERGRLLHGLFERLPAVRPDDRAKAARRWLEGQGVADTQSLVDTALAVLDDPAFAQVFSGNALAEAPLAGVDRQRPAVDVAAPRRVARPRAGLHRGRRAGEGLVQQGFL